MKRRKVKSGQQKASTPSRVDLIMVPAPEDVVMKRKHEVKKILAVMYYSLSKKGRPKKDYGELI